jgi:hypothetical protein
VFLRNFRPMVYKPGPLSAEVTCNYIRLCNHVVATWASDCLKVSFSLLVVILLTLCKRTCIRLCQETAFPRTTLQGKTLPACSLLKQLHTSDCVDCKLNKFSRRTPWARAPLHPPHTQRQRFRCAVNTATRDDREKTFQQ